MITVFDLGKTNSKMISFDSAGRSVMTRQNSPKWIKKTDLRGDLQVLDEDALWHWINTSLAEAKAQTNTQAVIFSTHGCTCALIHEDHLALPILDYECEPPEEIEQAFHVIEPAYSETYSPSLPAGMNLAKQVFWMAEQHPESFQTVDTILCYPQYWGWRLAGQAVSEISFLGCHSHCWVPLKNKYSSLVHELGWRSFFPPLQRAGATIGPAVNAEFEEIRDIQVLNGLHDSNASHYFYKSLGYESFSLVSTGTWVIIFNSQCPLTALDQKRDMLANVTIDAEPVATVRFMGGRDYDTLSHSSRLEVSANDIADVMNSRSFALPSFSPGGPFPDKTGHIIGPQPQNESERASLASLYVACMTCYGLELIESNNTLIIDGGLSRNQAFLGLMAALRPNQETLVNTDSEGTALGTAQLAFEQFGKKPFADPCKPVEAWNIASLVDYYSEWKKKLANED